MAEEDCGLDPVCTVKDTLGRALSGVAGDAMQAIADAVTAAVVTTIAQIGTIWTTIDAGDLTGSGSGSDLPSRGVFNDRVDTLISHATWIGMGVSVIALILLGVTIASNARRGDGTGLVNGATIVFAGFTLIGGATAVVGFLVPARSVDVASTVGFVQDQTFYLTLALAVFSTIIAGARMVWTQRAEPAQDLIKGLLTLAVVSTSGVALLNILLQATDALAEQIITSAIGSDFTADVQLLLGLVPETPTTWIGGNVMLIIVGGLIAVMINIVQIMLMVLRTAMLFLLAGVLPLSASFMNTEAGKNWFAKIIAWTIAFAFYKPAAALIYATGIKLSESGLFEDHSLLQFCAGLILIIASVVALPVLIGFLSPALGAMSSTGGGIPLPSLPQSLPGGANGRQRGNGFPSAPPEGARSQRRSGGDRSAPAGSNPSGGGSSGGGRTAAGGKSGRSGPSGGTASIGGSFGGAAKTGTVATTGTGAGAAAGAGGGAAAAAPPVAAATVAVAAAKKIADTVSDAVQGSVEQSSGPPADGGSSPSGASPGTGQSSPQNRSAIRPLRQERANHNENEGSPDGADR